MEIYEGYSYRINIVASDSSVIVDSHTGLLKGCVADINENIIVDTYTSTFQGTLVGNVLSKDLNVIIDIEKNSLNVNNINSEYLQSTVIEADVIQSNISNTKGDIVFDQFHSAIRNISFVEAKLVTAEKISGTLVGNLCDEHDDIIVDTFHKVIQNIETIDATTLIVRDTIHGQLKGDILNKNGHVVFDFQNNQLNLNNISTIGQNFTNLSSLNLQNDLDLNDDNSVNVVIHNLKTSNNFSSGINLCRGYGSGNDVKPVVPGSNLSSIIFSGVIGNSIHETEGVGFVGARVAADSSISDNGFAGEIIIAVKGYNNEQIEGIVLDANGHTKTVLKDFSVVGNTISAPANKEIDSWLEVIVNGKKKFIPLYS